MKRLLLSCVMIMCVFLMAECALISRNDIAPAYVSFDMETDGLVQVQTVHESDKNVKNYALASGIRIMDTGEFIPDDMQVCIVRSFSTGKDNIPGGPLKVYDEANREVPVTREIDTICHAMRDVGHHVMECRILRVGDECFVSAGLNVNLWTPYQFYYFNQDSGRLMLLYEYNGRDVTAVRILSAERLHSLDQHSIGGWYEPFTPEQLMNDHPDILENAAQLLLRRSDLFDEADVRGFHHNRKLAVDSFSGFPFDYLLHGVTYYGRGGSVTYLNDDEKAVFQSLLDICPPYEIQQIPGSSETCTILIFRFSAFDQETNRQEEWTLFRLSDPPKSFSFAQTVSQLKEQFGELIPCRIPGWMMKLPKEG